MKIIESGQRDKEAIKRLHLDAFDPSENEIVAQLAVDLLDDPTADPLLSLVAVDDNQIAAHILFTPVSIKDKEQPFTIYILAPLAVAKTHQGQGLGTKLIERGFQILKERGADIVLVLGDPKFYSRSGFKAGHNLATPYEIAYPEAWMAYELTEGALASAEGTIQCADSLNAEALW